jgi:hypothetical protein
LVVIHQRNLVSAADGTKSAFSAARTVAKLVALITCGNVSLLRRRIPSPLRGRLFLTQK